MVALLSIGLVGIVLTISASAQKREKVAQDIYDEINAQREQKAVHVVKQASGTTYQYGSLPQASVAGASTNWTIHNLDLANSRNSVLDQINTSNVGSLAVKWLFRAKESVNHCTPIVVDGVMYATSMTGFRVWALDAVTGDKIWTFELNDQNFPRHRIRSRGAVYGDGVIYAYAASRMFALDAKTGELLPTFGEDGVTKIVHEALKIKYPGVYDDKETGTIGYDLATAPTYFGGTVYITTSISEQHPPGGLVIAVDGKTGAVRWAFNTVPQGPGDDGWNIAKDTWVGGARNGGGIWTTPAIDPDLGMIYIMGANPSPDIDGSARKGMNLFTNSIIALDLKTGALKWYYQVCHHDIWDYDAANTPLLYDVSVGGKTVKAISHAEKTGYLYVLDRETGRPINPIVEMPVSTATNVPGEEIFPTQPIPFKANRQPQEPFVPTYPIISDPALAIRARPAFTPFLTDQLIIISPGTLGGANFGSSSFSSRTGLIYVPGIVDAHSMTVLPLGNTLKPGDASFRRNSQGPTGMALSGTVTAYDPATGNLVWQATVTGAPQGGNFVTAGDIVVQGTNGGYLFVLDAKTGKELFKFNAGARVNADPMTYQVNGKQYISVASDDIVITFALP
jgi:PQQ-dependent dehydrogenase (methanol/ethanol family)